MGRRRGGLTTKIHVLVDAQGLPLRLHLTPGQTHDSQAAEALLGNLPARATLLADKAYDADWIRDLIRAQKAKACIPSKSNRRKRCRHDRHCYKKRNRVERFFNKIKHFDESLRAMKS